MHGEADTRVSVMQNGEIYRALIDNGIDVEMVLYPDAGHNITSPKQRKNVFERWIDWYKKYLKE
jgi:dipeptidyl aminopeptidase/acylaminoacyl peptidase